MRYFYIFVSLLSSLAEGNLDEEKQCLHMLRFMYLLAENTFETVGYPDDYPANYIEVIISVSYPHKTINLNLLAADSSSICPNVDVIAVVVIIKLKKKLLAHCLRTASYAKEPIKKTSVTLGLCVKFSRLFFEELKNMI